MKLITMALAGMVALLFVPRSDPQDAKPAAQDAKPAPAAAKADVESVDATVKALYDVISGPAGQARDWDRFRSLFAPKARLVAMVGKGPKARSVTMTPEEYVEKSGPYLQQNGFFEREIAKRQDAFGDIAHVFSTYESRKTAADEKPFARGINSIQLAREKDRWWVVSVFWCEEAPDRPLPKEYLPK
jgi:hypothetical protein